MHRFFAAIAVVVSVCVYAAAGESSAPPVLVSATTSNAPTLIPSRHTVTIRRDVEEVRVVFHAVDRRNRPVMDIAPESLTVVDNGMRVPISGFHRASNLPLSVALMVDASDSVARDFAAQQRASTTFVRTLMRSNDDRVLLVSFREKLEVMRQMTSNADELAEVVKQIPTGGLTSLYDALVATSRRIAATDMTASRRAIVLISDGDDTDSRYVLADAIAAAVRNDVAVYAITVRGKRWNPDGERVLKDIADATGGRSYVVRRASDLATAMDEIECDLRNEYFVTYRPAAMGSGFHRVQLTSTMKDVLIRARAGYFIGGGH
jgi:VWFA-related protein